MSNCLTSKTVVRFYKLSFCSSKFLSNLFLNFGIHQLIVFELDFDKELLYCTGAMKIYFNAIRSDS